MAVVDSIPAWLPLSPYQAAEIAANASSESTCAAGVTPESTSSSCPSPSSSSSPPDSPFATPHSPPPSPFPDCERLADTLLAEIAAGTECLAAIAAHHHIPYPRFTLWLLQPATQERLAALSVAIASAARLTATAALPDIVRGLKTTVDQLQSQTHMTIAPAGGPGADHLRAESVILRRHRALIAAASLIYRISHFHPPCHRDRPRNEDDLGASAHARSRAPSARDNSAPPRRGLARLLNLDLPAIDFADLDPRPASDSAAASELLPREGEVAAKPPEGAPAFPTDSSRLSSSTSDIVGGPLPTSEIASDEPPISVDEALEVLIDEYDLDDEEAAELRADPKTWIREVLAPALAAAENFDCKSSDDG